MLALILHKWVSSPKPNSLVTKSKWPLARHEEAGSFVRYRKKWFKIRRLGRDAWPQAKVHMTLHSVVPHVLAD